MFIPHALQEDLTGPLTSLYVVKLTMVSKPYILILTAIEFKSMIWRQHQRPEIRFRNCSTY